MPDTKTGQIHFGSWDFDYDVRGFEGLSLLNGKYRGRSAFGVFSMPVIRVKYLKDGGLGDILRFLSEKLKMCLGSMLPRQRAELSAAEDQVLALLALRPLSASVSATASAGDQAILLYGFFRAALVISPHACGPVRVGCQEK